jgi:hypothetical protein
VAVEPLVVVVAWECIPGVVVVVHIVVVVVHIVVVVA